MAAKLNAKAYLAILRVKPALIFDAGCLLMRLYAYMVNIGTMAMMTMAGYSFLDAGLTSSVIAIATFVIAPRVSKLVDEQGQSRVVPLASSIALAGLVSLLAGVNMHAQIWQLLICAAFMGFLPNPQALARARWTCLIRSGRLGDNVPSLQAMFSYEGVIDDIGFMFGPTMSIALATAIAPTAGMLAGGVAYVVGMLVLVLARSTDPGTQHPAVTGARVMEDDTSTDGHSSAKRPIICESPIVCALFAVMLFVGAFFSTYDASIVAIVEELGDPALASGVLMMVSCLSMVTGFAFGLLRLPLSSRAQLLLTAALAGGTYGCMFLVDSAPTLIVFSAVSALFYAPLLITANATCERAVPTQRITEAITWINAGMTCGMALGPTVSGFVIDIWGAAAGFDVCAVLAICVPLIALIAQPMMKGQDAWRRRDEENS